MSGAGALAPVAGGIVGCCLTAVVAWTASVLSRARQHERVLTACHELRGPITAIGLGVELAQRTGLTAARARAIELELARAARAVDDLTGNGHADLRVRCDGVDIAGLLADSCAAWRPVAGERALRLELAAGFSAQVLGDRARLAQAVGNLLANAIEHGRGEIAVRARASREAVRIEVVDHGDGLPETVALLVGGRTRVRPAWARSRGGFDAARRLAGSPRGRGLRIAAEVVTAHHGRMFSAPAPCGGRVVIELPRASAAPQRSRATHRV